MERFLEMHEAWKRSDYNSFGRYILREYHVPSISAVFADVLAELCRAVIELRSKVR